LVIVIDISAITNYKFHVVPVTSAPIQRLFSQAWKSCIQKIANSCPRAL